MMTFRIVTNGSKFRVQCSRFCIFWTTFTYVDDRGEEFPRGFDTVEEARSFVRVKLADPIYGKEQWTSVEYL